MNHVNVPECLKVLHWNSCLTFSILCIDSFITQYVDRASRVDISTDRMPTRSALYALEMISFSGRAIKEKWMKRDTSI